MSAIVLTTAGSEYVVLLRAVDGMVRWVTLCYAKMSDLASEEQRTSSNSLSYPSVKFKTRKIAGFDHEEKKKSGKRDVTFHEERRSESTTRLPNVALARSDSSHDQGH
jgi:hypothetical protein